jgi:hypothetical protein
MDSAFDIAKQYRPQLQQRFDVDHAMRLLLKPPLHARNTADVTNCLRMIAALRAAQSEAHRRSTELDCRLKDAEQLAAKHAAAVQAVYKSRSWRMTAPIRTIVSSIRRSCGRRVPVGMPQAR